jgi:nuclear transcription factor Y, gamma
LETENHDYKIHQLPLARIKKVMKADPEVKMISAEAPILFAKGCDIFITELTMRAWIHAEENKRRTLQRSDIASALGKSDMFDFLIDIVPREEATSHKRSAQSGGGSHHPAQPAPGVPGAVPQQHPGQGQPGMHPQPPHHMAPPGYDMGQQMPGEHGFREQQQMYGAPPGAPQMQPDPNNPYSQQMPFLDQNTYQQYGMGQPVRLPLSLVPPWARVTSVDGVEVSPGLIV